MANTKQTVTDELEQFYNEPVPVTLIKDNWKKKDDLTVTVNGTNYQIKRGVEVWFLEVLLSPLKEVINRKLRLKNILKALKRLRGQVDT